MRISEAYARHATYYLNIYFAIASRSQLEEADWREYEADLQNLRNAWEWLKDNKDLPVAADLFFKYAELGWLLLEFNRRYLLQIVSTSVARNQSANDSNKSNKEIIQKLNNLLSSQEQIISALPMNEIFGNRNVQIGGSAINTSIYTGNNVFVNTSNVPDYRQAIESAYKNNDLKLVGVLLFKKSKILHKFGCLPEAFASAEKALKIFNEIEDGNTIDVQKQLSEWEETSA